MSDLIILLIVCSVTILGFWVGIWRFICIDRTQKKRLALIKRWGTSGDGILAQQEFDRVSFERHLRFLFWFKNPKQLYGPLLQGVWDQDYPPLKYDLLWWRCYNEIYRILMQQGHWGWVDRINRKYATNDTNKYDLIFAMTVIGIDLTVWLDANKAMEAPQYSMIAGAEEYDQIMQAQEMMDG